VLAAVSSWLTAGCLSIMPAIAPKAKHVEPDISAEFPFEYRSVDVLDSQMSYVEAGTPDGPPVVLVHGNPTSAYLWRNVIPHLERTGRVIAVDLIGMGQSGKPNLDYRFEDHVAYFDAFMEALELRDVVLVAHDWGGGVAIDYAARHPENVRGIAHFEAVVKPMSFAQADAPTRFLFKKLRDPDEGHALIAEDNYFVERLLPMMAGRRLSEDEMAAYRAPFQPWSLGVRWLDGRERSLWTTSRPTTALVSLPTTRGSARRRRHC
jgi:haloalkane dehalogenase